MSDSVANKLFRKATLDKLASPEQLDSLITVADTTGWIAAIGLAIVLVAALGWGIFGAIPTEVDAQGILVSQGGRVVPARAPASGTVTRILVRTGDHVVQGQAVARISQDALALRLADAKQVVAERLQAMIMRKSALASELAALETNASQRREAFQQVLTLAGARLERLRNQLQIREKLRSQNLVTEDRVEQTRSDIASALEAASDARAHLTEIDADRLKARINADRELNTLQQGVADAERNVRDLHAQLTENSTVRAPESGRVTELTVAEGQLVTASTLVLNVETEGRKLQAVVYVPTEHGKQVQPGMRARLEISTVRKEDFGTLAGTVQSVSAFPATPQGMAAVLQNPALATSFSTSGAPYEARINLIPAHTPTGYAWTSGTGPAIDLTSGTTLKAEIVVREDAPINLIVPFIENRLGLIR